MLKDCLPGSLFTGTVLVSEWKESPFRQKQGTFVMLTCQDASGSLPAKIWEPDAMQLTWLSRHRVFQIKAAVGEYKGGLELAIEAMRPLAEDDLDFSLLLPSSPFSGEELEMRLQKIRRQIAHPALTALVAQILDDAELGAAFRRAPAAAKIHQAYLRGLWEHSLAVAELAGAIGDLYPESDRDLLLTGALLHDLGKIEEYGFEPGVAVTTNGRLLGHIVMGVEMISRAVAEIPEFPADLRLKLLHIITSHHGRYEWQSPRRPKCLEALIVHYADALEADLWQFRRARADNPGQIWSPYLKPLERCVYLE